MSSPPTFERTSRTSPRSGRLTRSLRLQFVHDPDSLSDCLKGLLPAHGRSCTDVAASSPDSPVQDTGAFGRLVQPDIDRNHLRLPEPRHLADGAVPPCHVPQHLRRHLAAALTDALRDNTVIGAHDHDLRSADVRLLRLLDCADLRYQILQGSKPVNRFAEAVPARLTASAEHVLRRVNLSDCLFHPCKTVHA